MTPEPTYEEDAVLFSQLYSKLAASLSQMGVVGNSPSSLLSIQIPGITVEPGLDPSDPDTQYYISNFLNFAIECNYVSTVKAGSVSDVYKLILDGKEMALTELTKAEKKELSQAEYLLWTEGEPTNKLRTYQLYAMRFYCAFDALSTAKATEKNGGEAVPQTIKDAYKTATEDWDKKGYKEQIEQALAVVAQLQAKQQSVYWNNLNNRYSDHTKQLDNGSTFQYVGSMPEYKDWFKPDLWTPFRFDEKDYENQSRSGGLGMSGSACCCCSEPVVSPTLHLGTDGRAGLKGRSVLQRPTAGYNSRHRPQRLFASWHEAAPDTETPFRGDATTFAFSCEFKRIVIVRPWMDTNVFYSRTWRWSPMSIGYGIEISTGGSVAGNEPAKGVMPLLPTTALLGKEIKFTTTDAALMEWLETEFSQGKQVRFGPFRLGNVERVLQGDHGGYSVTAVAAPQIFGYISTIFQECPNPDLTLKWPEW